MLKLSKQTPVKKTINGRTYKLKKWSTITTSLEGMKLAKVLAPSFTMVADMWMGKSEEQRELEAIHQEAGDNLFMLTGAITQLCAAIGDEHFLDLQDKLLSNLQIIVDDEAVDIPEWSDHIDEYPQDWDQLLVWSIKENLWDFFMKQATFASKIETVVNVLKPLTKEVENLIESKEMKQ